MEDEQITAPESLSTESEPPVEQPTVENISEVPPEVPVDQDFSPIDNPQIQQNSEITDGWHTGHNPFYTGSPDIDPNNPHAGEVIEDWSANINRENR
jgi:hypothetical protein